MNEGLNLLLLLANYHVNDLFISLSSIVNVSIEVEDVNDNSPEFINEPYAAVIIEVCIHVYIQLTIVILRNMVT
jgi:hypothetical protein